jgi:predicted RND superfamily exporter protein
MLMNAYVTLVLKHPRKVLAGILLLILFLGWNVRDFRLDASADSLVIEGDADLEFSREIDARYGSNDFVFIAYTPEQDLFSEDVLDTLRALKADLLAIASVESVDSMLDVPLFKVANASLSDVTENLITLETPGVDLAAARADLTSNAAYLDVLLNAQGSTTALIVNFEEDTELQQLLARRTELRRQEREDSLDDAGKLQLALTELNYDVRRDQAAIDLHTDIVAIREVLSRYRDSAQIVMGGVPMIADDLVTFVRSDLETFGVAILLFIVVALGLLFRKPRYVLIPLTCGLVVTAGMMGLLGSLDWPVTVISSNFVSLLLITTVSLTIHLIVRYRELEVLFPDTTHEDRLGKSLRDMVVPATYTCLTTIVAFASLVTSSIPPVIDFGLMMFIGIFAAFVISFLLFPAAMVLLPVRNTTPVNHGLDITPAVASFTEKWGRLIMGVGAGIFVFAIIGITQLRVENSFIEYFDESTDIYQGMVAIDQQLGGTTPLDVVIDLARPNPFGDDTADEFADEDAAFGDDEFAFEDEEEAGDPDAYWFTSDKMQTITDVHNWLDELPETGKVLSLATLLNIAYELNDDRTLSSFELGVLYNSIPADYKETLLRPYVSVAENQVRFSIRVRETDETLVRNELLGRIQNGLVERFGFAPEQVRVTGMLVLYNNMLQSLFQSQIMTLGLSMLATFVMFLVLFRSFKLALIGQVPTFIATFAVLGLMGWLEIPLDMMTITIAAISVGIGVDNTIYYMHRFRESFPDFGNYRATMHYCHGSIGKGIYYTNFTIIAGFSILVLSNFVPTVYFGLLTSLSMVLSLTGSLTLLPQLLITFKPLGPETTA